MRKDEEPRGHILRNISIQPNGCWLWQKALHLQGYGAANVARKHVKAHRLSYEAFVGPIPIGLHLDHLCRNRACVNPAHLEPVTCRENLLRGISFSAQNAKKTHCHKGHELFGPNLYLRPGNRRGCRKCSVEYEKAKNRKGHPNGPGRRGKGVKDRRGPNATGAKLSAAEVIEIRKLAAVGLKQKEIAKKYNIDRSSISRIVHGLIYTNVGEHGSDLAEHATPAPVTSTDER